VHSGIAWLGQTKFGCPFEHSLHTIAPLLDHPGFMKNPSDHLDADAGNTTAHGINRHTWQQAAQAFYVHPVIIESHPDRSAYLLNL